ncbi:antibiotic biosynthesis monooxygenase (ABM) superfamily enzyme [Algoriphagus sp. 4150]|uniref:hypothetical protein n=1 Tax=Algoriphagus sp. 4150 TaxID=2817756 RepID=UPI0028638D8B|nr:hypothetical protein [Algoriphagus sp. 4150]MDR7127872.1 antibiotic biosynthesis monooxygenase (ABM) superfamily enzyme [Algoriphagus sp. 4150]
MEELLNSEYWENSVQEYLIMLGGIILGLALVKIFKNVLLKRISHAVSKTKTTIDDFIVESIGLYVVPMVYFTVIYAGLKTLVWPERMTAIMEVVYVVILTYYSIVLISGVIRMLLQSYIRRQEGGRKGEADGRSYIDYQWDNLDDRVDFYA